MTITRLAPIRIGLPVFAALLIGEGALASGAVAARAHRPTQASIKTVVLTSRDVTGIYGKGFKPFIDGIISNKDLASAEKSSVSSVTRTGRVTGYDSVWFRGNKTASLSLSNGVSEYKTSSYPRTLMGQIAGHPRTKKGYTFHTSSLGGIGDEALLYTTKGRGATSLTVIFRRGSYFAQVSAGTQHGTVSQSSLAKLATIEDQRIQAHG